MAVTLEKNHFSSRDEALDEIKARKLWPLTSANAFLEREELHWHPYSNTIFVIEGEADCYVEGSDDPVHVTPGDIISVPPRTLHGVEAKNEVILFVCFEKPLKRDEMVALPPAELHS